MTHLYQNRFNLQDATFTRVEHEDAIVAIVYKVMQADGPPLILKICKLPSHYFREVYFLEHLAGKLPVPRLVKAIPPEKGIDGAVLMECLPGTVLRVAELNDVLAHEMGQLLARIHLNQTSGYGDLTKPESLKQDPRPYFTMKFAESLSECTHLPKSMIEPCQNYFDAHIDLLSGVDGPCMAHRDYRPGNVMVHKGKIQGIIDWSSASASFAEEDFCSMKHGETFLNGYATVRPVPNYGAIMPLLRLSKAVAVIGYLMKSGTWETSQARLYQLHRRFLETLLEIKS